MTLFLTNVKFLFTKYITVNMWNSVASAAVFPPKTVIFMRLPDLALFFTSEVWVIIKALDTGTN